MQFIKYFNEVFTMKNMQPVRGTYDYAPIQAENREIVKQKILKSYQNNGFSLITTPILENLELLDSSDGGDNLRLMFRTIKRGDKLDLSKPNLTEKDLCEEGLRYDLTVPLARFYAGNRESLPNPFKAIQIDYAFRAERPQKGRDRQFLQCDIDIMGDSSVNAEIDIITTALNTYKELGIDDVTMKINDRRILNALILNFGFKEEEITSICVSLDKFDKIGYAGVQQELISKQYNPTTVEQLLVAMQDVRDNGIQNLSKYGVEQSLIDNVTYLINTVNSMACGKCEFDLSIIRGQGYYTGTVYEAYASGFNGAIGGGGRYDKMIEKLIGINVPAVGFSIGFVRVMLILESKNIIKDKLKVALIYDATDDMAEVLKAKQCLMKDYAVSIYLRPKNMKAMLDRLKFANYDAFTTLKDENIKMI